MGAVGVVFVHTGICGVETITSHDLAGSGAATGALVVTCTGFEFSRCTKANAGLFDVSTGTCTEEITTQLWSQNPPSLADAAVLSKTLSSGCSGTRRSVLVRDTSVPAWVAVASTVTCAGT